MESTFGGLLKRVAKNSWQWSDGTPEPLARDLGVLEHYSFREAEHDGFWYVEIPLAVAHKYHDELGWVLDAMPEQKTSVYPDTRPGKRAPTKVMLLPDDAWKAWAVTVVPTRATWDADSQECMINKARSLGWEKEKQ